MKYALFLGCTIPARAMNYEISTRKMAEKLGIELVDLEDFSCCGLPIKSVDFLTSIVWVPRISQWLRKKGLMSACSAMDARLRLLRRTIFSSIMKR